MEFGPPNKRPVGKSDRLTNRASVLPYNKIDNWRESRDLKPPVEYERMASLKKNIDDLNHSIITYSTYKWNKKNLLQYYIHLPCEYTNEIYTVHDICMRKIQTYYKHITLYIQYTYIYIYRCIHASPILGAPLQFVVCLVQSPSQSPGSLAHPSSLRVAAKPPSTRCFQK